ncbi:MAG: prolipoprotein diacylglyceryl transferase [Rhodothermales bacterium]|nr:prolipoprotein diacylglyceryl transferase [Rhodothermales bacterium]MBO6780234.1 prolipoprotein diacylglyceryl transferase [Rhodothermales bacterium]
MYPRLSDIFQDWFGFEFPIPIYSFGFMVAAAVMLAGWLGQRELDRLYEKGRAKGIKVPADKADKKKGRKGRMVEVSPSYLMGTITVIVVVGGFAGAKLFHILENLDLFFRAPGRMIFSSGGFTFYGGLIAATVLVVWYLRKQGQNAALFADAVAPGVMLAYGVGRIGCHLSGDGDWGIAANVAAKPDWLPMWLWAEDYPNNHLGIDLSAAPVYPTPIYEFTMAAILFLVLFSLRDHPFKAGWLFGLYLVFAGIERFLIEKIRVNNEFELLGLTVTQAEVISVTMILLGGVLMYRTWQRREEPETRTLSTAEA